MKSGAGEEANVDPETVLGTNATALEVVGTIKPLTEARRVRRRAERNILWKIEIV